MTITAGSLRVIFPEFGNVSAYPDSAVSYWIGYAYRRLNEDRWKDLLDDGVIFLAAHNLALQGQALEGGGAARSRGVITSEAVDRVSVTYDSMVASIDGAGNFNLTDYGKRYFELANIVGMGGSQL